MIAVTTQPIQPTPIKNAIAALEKAVARLADAKASIPQLRADADKAMREVDTADKAAIREIVENRTTADVLEKQLPALEARTIELAEALLAEVEKQRPKYLARLEGQRSAYEVRITNLLREFAPVIVERNGERFDTARRSALTCPVFYCFEDRYPSIDMARVNGTTPEKALDCARAALALHEQWIAYGKSFVPPNYGADCRAA